MFKLLAFVVCFTSFTVGAADFSQIATTVNQRLSYMKDVAGFKAEKHLAVEDRQQEHSVLANTQSQAASLGLDPASIEPFIMAQMDAAKAIQYRYRADWLADAPGEWQPRPLDEVRLRIADLSAEMLVQLRDYLRDGKTIDDGDRAAFMQIVEQQHLTDADKQRLFSALKQVRQAG